jgi:hypothetical protein
MRYNLISVKLQFIAIDVTLVLLSVTQAGRTESVGVQGGGSVSLGSGWIPALAQQQHIFAVYNVKVLHISRAWALLQTQLRSRWLIVRLLR